ncbi:hypothetical protein ACFY97_34105 [Streptomyces klenkii]
MSVRRVIATPLARLVPCDTAGSETAWNEAATDTTSKQANEGMQ